MEAGLDTGPMLYQVGVPIDQRNAIELTEYLAEMGASLMRQVLTDLNRFPPRPQPEQGVTYAAKIQKGEAHLDFSQPAQQVERQVRAFNPSPGAFFEFMGERIRILEAQVVPGSGPPGTITNDSLKIACGERAIRPLIVQRAGRNRMIPEELLRGFPIPKGAHLA
ncbi:MAG: methionyl-tRNA formyltransferase, partial [Sphingomicrobium sp.]